MILPIRCDIRLIFYTITFSLFYLFTFGNAHIRKSGINLRQVF
jgi:hypothetical protein